MDSKITGVEVTSLKKIFHPMGDVYHCMKKSDPGFEGFGEAYFSTVNYGEIKSWKKHKKMTLNFTVPVGAIKIVVFDNRDGSETKGTFFEIILSLDNYQRITIAPDLWVAFAGMGEGKNLLLNIASLEHDPLEADRLELSSIIYDWNEKTFNHRS
jgi:dTDP-4-dehydrorhamnose 3,5-epimerase